LGLEKEEIVDLNLELQLELIINQRFLKNITLENRLSLYSDYLDKPQNVDFDCTFNFVMKVNQYISTNLIFQFVYDDNEIKRVQVREVLGLGLNIDLSNIDLSNIGI